MNEDLNLGLLLKLLYLFTATVTQSIFKEAIRVAIGLLTILLVIRVTSFVCKNCQPNCRSFVVIPVLIDLSWFFYTKFYLFWLFGRFCMELVSRRNFFMRQNQNFYDMNLHVFHDIMSGLWMTKYGKPFNLN